ncbi:MAG: CoA transferase, partial [Burkholderiaceae bacterium]|nr:CoA transferase [Burkholderiaceae bacterium]
LAAIIHKLRTGEGQFVEVPMFESMVSFNTLEHLCDNTFVPATASPGYYQRQLDPTRQPMRTKDGYIAFAPYLDDRWIRFFEAAGHAHVLKEERFIDKPTRRKNMSQMFEVMARIAPERTTDEWLALMKKASGDAGQPRRRAAGQPAAQGQRPAARARASHRGQVRRGRHADQILGASCTARAASSGADGRALAGSRARAGGRDAGAAQGRRGVG